VKSTVVMSALLLASSPSLAAADANDVPGTVVLARATGEAVALYDASPEVAAVVRERMGDTAARGRLAKDALRVLAKEIPDVSQARSVVVRVTYTRSGDVSPVYGTPTFAGIERYANLKARISDVRGDKSDWARSTKLPKWAKFEVVGKLPPR